MQQVVDSCEMLNSFYTKMFNQVIEERVEQLVQHQIAQEDEQKQKRSSSEEEDSTFDDMKFKQRFAAELRREQLTRDEEVFRDGLDEQTGSVAQETGESQTSSVNSSESIDEKFSTSAANTQAYRPVESILRARFLQKVSFLTRDDFFNFFLKAILPAAQSGDETVAPALTPSSALDEKHVPASAASSLSSLSVPSCLLFFTHDNETYTLGRDPSNFAQVESTLAALRANKADDQFEVMRAIYNAYQEFGK